MIIDSIKWVRSTFRQLKPYAERTGLSTLRLFCSFEACKYFQGASMEHFLTFHMYEDNNYKRSQYLTLRRARKLEAYLDQGHTSDADRAELDDKSLFCRNYADFIRHKTLFIPASTPEQLRAFIADMPRFVAKEINATQGKGVQFYDSACLDADAYIADNAGKPILLEEYIQQHPAMAALNPATVNTVRVVTARHNGQVLLLSCFLRVGGAGQEVDNFHHGGVVYHLDPDGGFVMLPGKDELAAHTYVRHPTTGHIMPGFQVPHWEQVVDACRKAAMRPKYIGLVGWDVAILPDGIEFIEANTKLPGPTAMQLWGPGIQQKLRDFIEKTAAPAGQ